VLPTVEQQQSNLYRTFEVDQLEVPGMVGFRHRVPIRATVVGSTHIACHDAGERVTVRNWFARSVLKIGVS